MNLLLNSKHLPYSDTQTRLRFIIFSNWQNNAGYKFTKAAFKLTMIRRKQIKKSFKFSIIAVDLTKCYPVPAFKKKTKKGILTENNSDASNTSNTERRYALHKPRHEDLNAIK